MQIVKPVAELWETPENAQERLLHMEKCIRVCYKSENMIAEKSAERLIRSIIKRGHHAALEHGWIVAEFDWRTWEWALANYLHTAKVKLWDSTCGAAEKLNFTSTREQGLAAPIHIISGNIRAWRDFIARVIERDEEHIPGPFIQLMQNNNALFEDLLPPWPYPNTGVFRELHENDLAGMQVHDLHTPVTVHFLCDRGVSHELVRHRLCSFCQESTRYCNYSKGKFGSEIRVIKPETMPDGEFEAACAYAEMQYMKLIGQGVAPEIARAVLPTCLATELVVTANLIEWKHVLELRCAKDAHPQARQVCAKVAHQLAAKWPDFKKYAQ